MAKSDPALDPRQHAPPGRDGRGEQLLEIVVALLCPGPMLAVAALAARDPALGVLAARVSEIALLLGAPLCLLAALRWIG
jgi:hypothetical protein